MFDFGLELWANITISVLIWLFVAYLLTIVVDLVFLIFFKRTLHKHAKSLSIALASKFDNVQKLFAIMKKLGVKIDRKYDDTIESISSMDFKKPYTNDCKMSREKLTYLRDEAMFIARTQPNLEKNNEFITAKNNVLEMDNVYHVTVSCYNADVLGYNYWLDFFPTRWIHKIRKATKKDLIQRICVESEVFLI